MKDKSRATKAASVRSAANACACSSRRHRAGGRWQLYRLEQVGTRYHADDTVALVDDGQVAQAHCAEQRVPVQDVIKCEGVVGGGGGAYARDRTTFECRENAQLQG